MLKSLVTRAKDTKILQIQTFAKIIRELLQKLGKVSIEYRNRNLISYLYDLELHNGRGRNAK